MQKILLIILIFFLSVGATFAQPWTKNLPTDKTTELTLFDYEKAFNDYWAPYNVDRTGYYVINGEKKKARGWKQFHRWHYRMETQVDATTGQFPARSAQQVYDEYVKNTNPKDAKNANWVQLGPDNSTGGYAGVGRVNCVAFHPSNNNTWWVGAPAGGLWMTTNNGSTWTCLTDDNDVLGVSDICIPSDYATSQTIYIATGDRDAWDNRSIGVLKSTNGGTSWNTTGLSYDIGDGAMVNRILIDPNNNQILIAATSDGVFKTTNGGTTWSTQLSAISFIDMEYKPGDFNTLYGSTTGGEIWLSTNGGTNWSNVLSDGYRIELAVTAANATYVYALVEAYDSGLEAVYRSTNSGASFTQVYSGTTKNLLGWDSDGGDPGGQGWYDLSLAASPSNANTIVVGGVNTWKSTNGGTSWSIINHWWGDGVDAVHADKHMLSYRSNGDLFECNDGGIYISTNGGTDWTDKTNGMVISQMYKLGVSQTVDDETITGLQDNGSKLLSGGVWDDVKGGDGMECLIDYTNVNTQYATYVNGQIDRTTNHWGSSTAIEPSAAGDGAWVTPYIIDPANNSTLYAGYSDVYKTTNKGNSWTKISTMNTGSKIRAMAISPSNSSYIYVSDPNQIWKTTNGGSSWTEITGSLPVSSNTITYIAVKADDPTYIWVTLSGYNSNKVYRSTNGGTSWTNISTGLPSIPVYTIVQNEQIATDIHLYVGTELGVYFKDGDANWVSYNTGLPNVKCGELEIYYDATPTLSKLRLATYGRGLWESDLMTEGGAATPDATILATPGCFTGTITVSSSLTGSQTFYLTDNSGSVLNSATVNATFYDFTGLADGTYRGKVENSGQMSALSSPVALTNFTAPAQPSNITGETSPCQGDVELYSVTNVAGVSYAWTLPSGWSGSSTSNTINATVGAVSGNILIIPSNSCGNGLGRSLTINVSNPPAQPSAISGVTSPCLGDVEIYSVTNVSGVSYNWSLPAGWSGSSTTNSISATIGANSGNISITPSNICGNGPTKSLSVNVSTVPVQPSIITGNDDVCEGSQEIYSVVSDPNVTSYIWVLPNGWSGTSTTNSITVTVGSTDGNITVTPSNACGTGPSRSLSTDISSAPNQPSAISGNTSPCEGNVELYSVTNVSGVTYNWNLPSGWLGSSTTNTISTTVGAASGIIIVTPSNNCGNGPNRSLAINVSSNPVQPSTITGEITPCQGDVELYSVTNVAGVSYAWTLPSGWSGSSTTNSISATVGANSGDIIVTPSNSCGNGTARTLAVLVSTVPTQPSAISGNDEVCQGTQETYSVANDANVTSYAWTIPAGWSGTSTTNSITVTVGANNGNISVTPSNACGTGPANSMAVTVSNSGPPQPGEIVGDNSVCQGSSQTYSVPNDVSVTTYTWTLPAGWSGSSTTNSITCTVGGIGGEISVVPSNLCGSGPAQTTTVEVTSSAPAQPSAIAGPDEVCENSSQTYSVTLVDNIDYTWVLPADWSGASFTNEINVEVGATSGEITVIPANGCGSGPSRSLFVNVLANPVQPSNLAGEINPCEGTQTTYSVDAQSGMDFNWTLPTGWSGVSTTNTIIVTVGMPSGTISVTASNLCGTSTAATLSVNPTAVLGDLGTISGPGSVYDTQGAQFSINPVSEADSYDWVLASNWEIQSGEGTNSVYIFFPAGATSGTLQVSASNECGESASSAKYIQVIPIGLDEQNNTGMSIYPNPSSGIVTLELNHGLISDADVKVFTLEGKLVFSDQLKAGALRHQIDLNNLESGNYYIDVRNSELSERFKLVLNK